MKKFTTLVAMMSLLFTGNAQAQQAWEYEPTALEEITPGDNHYYAIQQGIGKAGVAVNGYLNTKAEKVTQDFDHTCIFQFFEVGTKESNGETFKIFVLKNINNNQYVCDVKNAEGHFYTPNIVEAFKFTARKAKEVDPKALDKEDWYSYSNAVQGISWQGDVQQPGMNVGAEAEGNWVFCSPDAYKFMAFNGNPAFSTNYILATNWRVYAATAQDMNAYDKFDAAYTQYFSGISINEENFPIGTDPGCVSEAMYKELVAVYEETTAATSSPQTDAEYKRLTQLILDVFAKLDQDRIPLSAGYYAMVNQSTAGGLMAGELTAPICNKDMTNVPETWTIDNAKYIWKLEEVSGAEDQYYIHNVATGRYISMGSNKEYVMTEKPKTKFHGSIHHGYWWIVKDNGKYFHMKQKDGKLNNYGTSESLENHWRFATIEASTIESLRSEIEQSNLNAKMANRVKHITINLAGLQNKCGLTMDGNYAYTANGLASEFEKTNATDTRDAVEEKNAFDRNVETIYQTLWSAGDSAKAPANENHWVQVNLGEPLQEVIVKFTRRARNASLIPTRIAIFGSEGDSLGATNWEDKLYEDTVVYTYKTEFADTIADSTTYINTIKFTHPVQHSRFTATETSNHKMINSGGPSWCLSELHFYNPANNTHNLSYDQIPESLINQLNAVIAKASAELESGLATQATLDELEAANDAVWEAYPNPNRLRSGLENAYRHYEIAVESATNESTDWGYYLQGAKAEFLNTLESIKPIVYDKNKVFTMDELKQLENQLEEAFNVFTSKLIVPANGVYRVMCASGTNPETGEDNASQGGYIASADPDYRTPAIWSYKDDQELSSRWNALWELTRNESGAFSIKNLATGWYLNNPYEGLTAEQQDTIGVSTKLSYSKTPKHINLVASPEAGKFVLKLKEGRFVNASSQKPLINNIGNPLTIWGNFEGENVRYIFESIEDLGSTCKIQCMPNATQIVSVPYDLQYAYTESSNVLKVVGRKGDQVILKPYDESENIPAGTPFIVKTKETESFFVAKPTATTVEELTQTTYNYSPVVQNGLVSALEAFVVKAGYGIPFQDQIMITSGGENIKAGSGFFNKDIPTTTEEGTVSLYLKGDLNGEGTAIENVIVNKEFNNDVYSITGVKVRQNINGSINVQGLPKGIYIIGNQKVFVK